MTYEKTNYKEVEPVADAMYFLRDELECEKVGVTVVEAEPGWEGMEHDHGEDHHEEVYLVVEGSVTVDIEGEEIELGEGDAVRVSANATRQIRNGESESKLVLVGAT